MCLQFFKIFSISSAPYGQKNTLTTVINKNIFNTSVFPFSWSEANHNFLLTETDMRLNVARSTGVSYYYSTWHRIRLLLEQWTSDVQLGKYLQCWVHDNWLRQTDREPTDREQTDREQRRLAEKGDPKYIFTIPRAILPKPSLCEEITATKLVTKSCNEIVASRSVCSQSVCRGQLTWLVQCFGQESSPVPQQEKCKVRPPKHILETKRTFWLSRLLVKKFFYVNGLN